MDVKEVMNAREAARYMGISVDTLYAYAKAKVLPAFKLGSRWRFKRSELDGWMNQASRDGAIVNRAPAVES